MFDKSRAVVYEDEDGNYVNAVELQSFVRTGALSFVEQTEEKNVMEDSNGNRRVLKKVAANAAELDDYNPDEDRYVEQVDWIDS